MILQDEHDFNPMSGNIYQHGLDKCAANHAALTPLGFLSRAAEVYPNQVAVIDGLTQKTWAEVYQRCLKMASALNTHGIGKGDTVAFLAPNSLASYEVHFGVPMSGRCIEHDQHPSGCRGPSPLFWTTGRRVC